MSRLAYRPLVSLLPLLLVACGDDDGAGAAGRDASTLDAAALGDGALPDASSSTRDDAAVDSSVAEDGSSDASADAATVPLCPRPQAAADRARFVVVAHPFTTTPGVRGKTYEVLGLADDGALASLGRTFEMGDAESLGHIAFSPDGQVGVAVQEDGTLGVFRLSEDGVPAVIDPGFRGTFYATTATFSPDGARVYVVHLGFREAGGGVYSVRIGCDGTLVDEGKVFEAKLGHELSFAGDGTGWLVATDALDSATIDGVHHVALSDGATGAPSATRLASAPAFPDDEAIVGGVAFTHDGRYAVVGDTSIIEGAGNRIGVVRLGDSPSFVGVLGAEDPVEILASPFDDALVVASGFGDAILVADYDPGDAATPVTIRGPLELVGARPQIPGSGVVVTRGPAAGVALIAENLGVRRVRFAGGGEVEDLGLFALGDSIAASPGAIGVTP